MFLLKIEHNYWPGSISETPSTATSSPKKARHVSTQEVFMHLLNDPLFNPKPSIH